MPRSLSFTEKRRARLRKAVDRIERLETRNTITEPISVTGLSISAFRGLAQLGIAHVHGGGDALDALQAASEAARQRGNKTAGAAILPLPRTGDFAPIVVGSQTSPTAAGGPAPTPQPAAASAPAADSASQASDWLSLSPAASDSDALGILTPWQAAKPAGGGAAQAPGGGSGALSASPAHGAISPLRVPPPSASSSGASSAVLAAAFSAGSAPAPTAAPGGVPSPNPGATAAAQPATPITSLGGTGGARGLTQNVGVSAVPENASSLPYAGSSPLAQMSFPYYPMYTLDYNNGIILFPGQYQQATPYGSVDLRAQVRDTTGVTFSWDTSHLTYAGSITGAATYRLQFQWNGTIPSPTVSYTTLTVTDANSHQESQTYYFVLPTTNIVSTPNSASWPETIAPGTALPQGLALASQNVSVDANTGSVDATIPLPSYNPNIPGLDLTYDSLAADPRPMILEHHTIDPTQASPTEVSAQLTFNGTAGTAYYYDTSKFTPGDIQAIALQANATSLSTGRYSYSVQVVDYRSTNTTFTLNGTATVLNESSSTLGDGWTLQGLEKITSASGGVILDLGSDGQSLWFTGTSGTLTDPAGDFSTLVANSGGTYTRTLTDGTQINFNSGGSEASVVDTNGLRTTFAYSGGNLSTITDPYNNATTFTYSGGYLQTITDPANRVTTFTHTGANLTGATLPDGSTWGYAYDGSGRLTQVTDPNSKTTSVAYDSGERASTIARPDSTTESFVAYQERGYNTTGTSGSPAPATLLAEARASYTDPNSNTTDVRVDWSGLGVANQVADPSGNVSSLDLNSNGLPIVSVDRLNRINQFTYDSKGNVTKQAYPDLNTDQYTYNSFSEPTSHTDANSHTYTYTYSSGGDLTVVQDPLNNLTTMTYTGDGMPASAKDANNHVTSYQYDSQDRLTTVTFPDSTTNKIAYDSKGNVTSFTDERGNSTTYGYDALNRETGITDALGNRTTYVYDSAGNLTAVQAPLSRTTNYAYDSMNRLTTVTDPLSHSTVYGFDSGGNLVTVKDPLGRVATVGYDAENRLTTVTDPTGSSTSITYDAEGQTITSTDPLGRTTSYSYSSRGFLAVVTDPLGDLVTYTYTPTGKPSGEYQTAGSQLTSQSLNYDADDRLISVTDGASDVTTFTYDGVGNRTTAKDPLSHVTSYSYDSRNRLVSTTDPLSNITTIGYDSGGNQQTVTDPLGHTSTTLYDALDRATTIVDALSGTTTILYDAAGRTTGLIDPVGNRTTWSYDAGDRLTTLTDPLNHSATYAYDNADQLTDTTDRNGRRTTFSYDNAGRQTGETWVGASPSEVITYTYDNAGELTKAADGFATLTYVYDNAGRMTTAVTSGPGTGQPTVTLTYAYNQASERTSLTDSLSSQGVTSYTYDSAMRVTSIAQSFGGTAGPKVVLGYDAASRLTSLSRQVGTSSTATQVNTTFVYDNADRLVTIQQSKAVWMGFGYNTTPLATIVYGYDAANRVTTQVDAEGTATFTYDNTNQLTAVGGSRTESYGYDANGNRNTTATRPARGTS